MAHQSTAGETVFGIPELRELIFEALFLNDSALPDKKIRDLHVISKGFRLAVAPHLYKKISSKFTCRMVCWQNAGWLQFVKGVVKVVKIQHSIYLSQLKQPYIAFPEAYGRTSPYTYLRNLFPNLTHFDIVMPNEDGRIILKIDPATGAYQTVQIAFFRSFDQARLEHMIEGLEGARVIGVQLGWGKYGNPDERHPDKKWNGNVPWPEYLGIGTEAGDNGETFIPVNHIKYLRLPELPPTNASLQIYPFLSRLSRLEHVHISISTDLDTIIRELGENCTSLKFLHLGADISIGFTLEEMAQAMYTNHGTPHLPQLEHLAFVLNLNGSFDHQPRGEPKKKSIAPVPNIRGRNLHIDLLINYQSSNVFGAIHEDVFKDYVDSCLALFHHPSVMVRAPFYGSSKFWSKDETRLKGKRVNTALRTMLDGRQSISRYTDTETSSRPIVHQKAGWETVSSGKVVSDSFYVNIPATGA